ncbi:MAG: hypothetical protein AB1420_07265 [Bacillota bacterium]
MPKHISKLIVMISLISIFLLTSPPPHIAEQVGPIMEVEKQITSLSDEETATLKTLFSLGLEMVEIKEEQDQLTHEMTKVKGEINDIQNRIAAEESRQEKYRSGLRQVLRSYQRMGPASYLEIILKSNSLSAFLQRINTLRDLAGNTNKLLISIKESTAKLEAEREKHDDKLREMDNKQAQLESTLARALQLQKEMEAYLALIEEKKDYYQKQLDNMQKAWSEFKPFFSETIKELALIIQRGEIPLDAVKTTITPRGVKGTIDEKTFNEIISGHPGLPNIIFTFAPKKAVMKIPEKSLVLEGVFTIVKESAVAFIVTDGTFYDLPLNEAALKGLFSEGPFVMDFKPLIGSNILHSIEVKEQQIELFILPRFLFN